MKKYLYKIVPNCYIQRLTNIFSKQYVYLPNSETLKKIYPYVNLLIDNDAIFKKYDKSMLEKHNTLTSYKRYEFKAKVLKILLKPIINRITTKSKLKRIISSKS